jgi:hypothetical protein
MLCGVTISMNSSAFAESRGHRIWYGDARAALER